MDTRTIQDNSGFSFYPAKRAALYYLREYLFPFGCGGCGGALLGTEDAYFGLCGECRALFTGFLAGEKHCGICGKLLISEKDTCLSCGRKETRKYSESLERVYSFFPYSGFFKTVLASFKFKSSLGIGNFFAVYLNEAVGDIDITGAEDAAWVPVPPRPGKIKKQGWDQIKFLAGLLRKERLSSPNKNSLPPVKNCLKRLPSKIQKELNREERETNLKGRILCVKKPPKTAILFDDVITTGATLNACAVALLEGGAEKVYGVCLFYG